MVLSEWSQSNGLTLNFETCIGGCLYRIWMQTRSINIESNRYTNTCYLVLSVWCQSKGLTLNPETSSPALMLSSWVRVFVVRSRWVYELVKDGGIEVGFICEFNIEVNRNA